MRMRVGDLLAPHLQPALHQHDLVLLRQRDAAGQQPHVFSIGARLQQRDHFQRLRVVADHVLHEPHVRRCVADPRQIDRFRCRDDTRRFARGARLQNRRTRFSCRRPAGGAATDDEQQAHAG
jgi:hypothetical protein